MSKVFVVGFGPGGMFAAYILAKAGLRPIVLERGKPVDERIADVLRFRTAGELDTESNIQFGEGGAGTFSDGKLNTGIRDERIRFVLETFVLCGAPEEILWQAKPHIGTDRLTGTVKHLRGLIERMGGQVLFFLQHAVKVAGIQPQLIAHHAIAIEGHLRLAAVVVVLQKVAVVRYVRKSNHRLINYLFGALFVYAI